MLLDQITQDLTKALKAGDKNRLDTLRFLVAAIKKFDIDTYLPGSEKKLTDSDVLKIIQKQVKQHNESITAFEKGGRPELAEKEKRELTILEEYVPAQMSDDEIKAIVEKVKAHGVANFGQAMGMVMKEVAGRADGGRVTKFVKEILSF